MKTVEERLTALEAQIQELSAKNNVDNISNLVCDKISNSYSQSLDQHSQRRSIKCG